MNNKEIILAAFGTTDPEGIKGVLNVYHKIKENIASVNTKLSFTADFIRRKWNKLSGTEEQIKMQKLYHLPPELFMVKGLIHQIGDCFDRGVYELVVQPLHIFHGEEYEGIKSIIDHIIAIKDKNSHKRKITLGRPLLGANSSKTPYVDDILKVVKMLEQDITLAKSKDACLVYIGHGNENFSTGAYVETEYYMQKEYGNMVYFANVEGFPFYNDLPNRIKKGGHKKVILKPFMLVAGEHAKNDIFGEDDSVSNLLTSSGIEVTPICQGLGEMDDIANIFLERVKDILDES
ncbi:MAG: sirohydrochlorin cobaltochelatase [Calditerrivibrio sp.]|nr:sirohydrochlorin cobaltochelatase [Calditerrivibrio sp.]